MEKVTKPIVRTLASGSELVMKQMQARAGDLLPKHLASLESLVFVHEGGGPAEIVGTEPALRFGSGDEAVERICAVLDSEAEQARLREVLAQRAGLFSEQRFMGELLAVVRQFAEGRCG